MWNCKPWDSKYRCSICAGTGRHPKYGDKCDYCNGNGFRDRYYETFLSKIFKFLKIRKKIYHKDQLALVRKIARVLVETIKNMKINTWLPVFPGFYNTLFDISDDLYRFQSDLVENKLVDEKFELNFNYAGLNNEICKNCCEWVMKNLPKESGIISVKLQEIRSPKEYNFTNDSANIEIEIDREKFAEWFNNYLKDWNSKWDKHLLNHYMSRDGFMSFYSSDYEEWAEITKNYKFDEENDDKIANGVHSLGRILEFYLENEGYDEESLYYYATESICADSYILNFPDIDREDLESIDSLRF